MLEQSDYIIGYKVYKFWGLEGSFFSIKCKLKSDIFLIRSKVFEETTYNWEATSDSQDNIFKQEFEIKQYENTEN